MQIQRIGVVVGVTHPIAETVGNQTCHQIEIATPQCSAALFQSGLRARGHPVEPVFNAIGRNGEKALTHGILQIGKAAELPLVLCNQRVVDPVGRRQRVARTTDEDFLVALSRYDQIGALPVLPGQEIDVGVQPGEVDVGKPTARGHRRGAECTASVGATAVGRYPAFNGRKGAFDSRRVQVPIGHRTANNRFAPRAVVSDQSHRQCVVARKFKVRLLDLERTVE